MATALNSVVGVSAASEAFRKCSADLIRGIQDPELLAWELYSDDVVSETVVDEVSVVGLSSVQRKTRLLSAVRDQIAVDPAKFQNLLLALRKRPPLKDLAEKLETIYNNCGMYTAIPHIYRSHLQTLHFYYSIFMCNSRRILFPQLSPSLKS